MGESKQARSATTALIYLTVGALIDVWSVVYYFYLWGHEGSANAYLMCHGFFFSGLVLLGIGMALGRIGRYARQAETTPPPSIVVAPNQPVAPAVAVPANGFVQQPVPVPPAVAPTPAPAGRF